LKKERYFCGARHLLVLVMLGIREDGEIVGEYIDDKGWTHEAL